MQSESTHWPVRQGVGSTVAEDLHGKNPGGNFGMYSLSRPNNISLYGFATFCLPTNHLVIVLFGYLCNAAMNVHRQFLVDIV